MGNCFSDPSSHPKSKSKTTSTPGGQKLGSGPARPAAAAAAHPPPQPRYNEPPRVLGGAAGSGVGGEVGQGGAGEDEQRARMIQAAEARAKSQSSKGVTTSNPKAGQLSAKLAAERKAATSPRQQEERHMDKGEWN